ncbi:MAG: 50S ribosomal protein L7/L12 [Candidatus Kerfeldbacteria bacterium CG15_BIG_FIL_POST_REV_8_21_14_020_45_12]|uniref:Large ribosomal subunit protein bL12 n=1 Tax=Candidatus Kerfeldbacteria bacterium CG15_BIG_FIL_POST_REV_8_21_14_020_45_12 TaxID=2014247 RepID=A0A2M7H2G7_9BACT|nr:MAG: 50S ribosomal protein L7/L12 [Candidatus Kerfeldbacteria bacterium CG15_BIG_FIL_POST_REV_8_21_14_020_45_12]PJA93115.1 MAG: 50S ribosomal protein L7/L12 [Candidatus Kerfeldbacteria bacterium CG_4_9_14_3_um_filter_45_8]
MSEENKDQAAEAAEEKKEVEVPEKFKSLVEQVEQMSVLDLAELVSILEDKFGVSAAAPMMMGGMMPAGGADAAAEEKSTYDVELTAPGENKISAIKAVREVTSLALQEAKALVDSAPSIVAEGLKTEDAEAMKAKLEEAGAQVTLK